MLMYVVLLSLNSPRLANHTGWLVVGLLVVFVTVEAPLSGMSMNPARTIGSAVLANVRTAWPISFIAPTLAMLLAAERRSCTSASAILS